VNKDRKIGPWLLYVDTYPATDVTPEMVFGLEIRYERGQLFSISFGRPPKGIVFGGWRSPAKESQ
jgi:hypothetical protein